MSILEVAQIAILFACVWGIICNSRTFRKRKEILDLIRRETRFGDLQMAREMLDDEQSVSYERHLLHIFFFLDPMNLYPHRLRERLDAIKRAGERA